MWSRQGELYELVRQEKERNGRIPEDTCPDIDFLLSLDWGANSKDVEKMMEQLRESNRQLRTLGIEWYEFCEELSKEGDKIIKDLEEEINTLTEENNNLKEELNQ